MLVNDKTFATIMFIVGGLSVLIWLYEEAPLVAGALILIYVALDADNQAFRERRIRLGATNS